MTTLNDLNGYLDDEAYTVRVGELRALLSASIADTAAPVIDKSMVKRLMVQHGLDKSHESIADTAGANLDCGECACLPGFCDKEGEVRSVLRMIVEKINAEGPASRDWQGFTHLCELAEQLLAAPSVADAAGASDDKALLDYLDNEDNPVDTIYFDDGKIIDVAGRRTAREAIRAAIAKESGND
ncbi:hypothetical protein [Caballeronia cordobensis]|uniref:hypothetical protein n=1 Tax=Caballeronia cordobensis TaxID=1353886 RepID=UPI00045F05F2|nr:hypothetical protein BRPE67_BCDS10490 [Burkholderia sp. RPE67]